MAGGSVAAPSIRWRESLDQARRLRMQGETGEALRILAEIDRELTDGESEEREREELGRWVERARFGGEVPSPDELDRLQRRIEKRVDKGSPNLEQAEREAIQLQS